MKIALLSLMLFLTIPLSAQVISLQSGVSISHLNLHLTPTNTFYNQVIVSPAAFVGIQYLERKYFDLSSSFGYLRKGGYEGYAYFDSTNNTPTGATFTLDYFSMNTRFELKFPIKSRITPFVSVGPRLDYLMHVDDRYTVFRQVKLNNVSAGMLAGVGFRYEVSKIQILIRGDYLQNFTTLYNGGVDYLQDETFLISASIGFRIK